MLVVVLLLLFRLFPLFLLVIVFVLVHFGLRALCRDKSVTAAIAATTTALATIAASTAMAAIEFSYCKLKLCYRN